MKCRNCGKEISNDTVFCSGCGTKVEVHINEQKDGKAGLKQVLPLRGAIILLIIIIVIIGFISVFIFKKTMKPEIIDPRVEANFKNGGEFAYDENTLFFIGKMNENDDVSSLYSTAYNGTNKKLILKDEHLSRIRICGERIIYYTDIDNNISAICSIDKYGEDKQVLKQFNYEKYCNQYNLYEGVLYYLCDYTLYAHIVSSEENLDDEVIAENVWDFVIGNDMIYYSTNDNIIKKYSIKEKNAIEICTGHANKLILYDDSLYFITYGKGIYKTQLNEGSYAKTIIKDPNMTGYFVLPENEDIYYVRAYDNIMAFDVQNESKLGDIVDIVFPDLDEDDKMRYISYIAASGEVCKGDADSGVGYEQDSDELLYYEIYASPTGMYYKTYLDSDVIEKSDIDILQE